MTAVRKIGTIRQLSLQCDTPTAQQRRKSLKKQFSEDAADEWTKEVPQRASSAKARPRTSDRPPSVKIAWSDNLQKTLEEQFIKRDESLIAKKCKEVRRPTTAKLTKQHSLDKDAVLYSRQELAEKLRQAWNDREKSKQNLDIFLSPQSKDKQDEDAYEVTDAESLIITEPKASVPQICNQKPNRPPEKDTVLTENYRNIFQKQIRKAQSFSSDIAYFPTRPAEAPTIRSSTIVVVPIMDSSSETKQKSTPRVDSKLESKKMVEPESPKKNEEFNQDVVKPINNVIIRPATASAKREGFQKRVNSAFHDSIRKDNGFRPPLVRSTSVPTKPEPKPKFLATKKRIKTAKRKEKVDKIVEDSGSGDENEEKCKNKKVLQRCVTLSNGEIETMVSLVSPAGSDTEEVEDKPKTPAEEDKSNNKPEGGSDVKKNFSLRKTVKSVSFQQSSIHAVRSFSASFPSRRGSIAATLLLGSNPQKSAMNKLQEKRAPSISVPDDDERVPKRRLVRTKSAPLKLSIDEDEDVDPPDTPKTEQESDDHITVSLQPKPTPENESSDPKKQPQPEEPTPEQKESNEPEFSSPKEKQCWELYCKMSGKGVNVSFDTILRGMLTPTEYRMRKKPSLEEPPLGNC